ncbi:MAG: HEAT repeat domain-containing protein [Bacillota bacterium]
MFLIPLEQRNTFRYHPLFREFLLNCLGNEQLNLLYRAGTITAKLGNIEKAIEVENTFIQRVLARLGQKGLELILSLAANPDSEVRRRIIIPLAEIGGVQARKAFRSLMEDPAPEVRELAG